MMNPVEPAFSEHNIPILFSSNDAFAPYLAVMLQSVIDHSSAEHNYDILIFHGAIRHENQERLLSMVGGRENISIRFVDVDSLCDDYAFFTETRDKRLTREIYYRLLAPIFLSGDYKKIIYLDGDMVTLTDIAALNDIDVTGYYLAAVYDITGIAVAHKPGNEQRVNYQRETLKLVDPDSYFISGLLVLNLDSLRADFPGNTLVEMAASRDWLQHDQDVLNVICNGGKALLLHPEWNVLMDYGANRFLPPDLMAKWLESEQHPKVIHYGGTSKPWNTNMVRQEFFWETAARTPFFADILKRILSASHQYREDELPRVEQNLEEIRQGIIHKSVKADRNSIMAELARMDSTLRLSVPAEPLISVIVCAYNEEETIELCLESLVNQTYRKLEIIVVDDGSTDRTAEICDRYAERDQRIRVIHKPNGGVASARNAGLRIASGDYIGWLDADDLISYDMYEYLVAGLHKYQTPVVICGHITVDKNSQVTDYRAYDQVLQTDEALSKLFSNQLRNYLVDRIWARWIFDGIEFEEGVVFEDFRVVYRLFEKARWITYLKTPKYYRILHDGSIVNTFSVKNRVQALQGHVSRYLDLNSRRPALGPLMLNQIYTATMNLCTAVKKDSAENYSGYQNQIRELTAFLRENRDAILSAASVGRFAGFAFDRMLTDHRAGWLFAYRLARLARIPKKWTKARKAYKKKFVGKLKKIRRYLYRVKAKLFPHPTTRPAVQNAGEESELQKEFRAWIEKVPEGTSLKEAKLQFFMNLPKRDDDIALIQRGNLYLLRRLKEICKANDISFWILGGTLLGAVRHHGFIPWDDDIDVGILRADYERLLEVMPSYPELRLDRYYHAPGPWQTIKLTLADPESPFWIDLLLYDFAGNRMISPESLWAQIQEVRQRSRSKLKKAAKKLKLVYRDGIVFDQKDAEIIDQVFSQAQAELPPVINRDYIYRSVDCVSGSWQQLFPVDRMMPFVELEYECETYPAPKDYEWYLELQYGDYLSVPNDVGHIHSRFIGDKLDQKEAVLSILNRIEQSESDRP